MLAEYEGDWTTHGGVRTPSTLHPDTSGISRQLRPPRSQQSKILRVGKRVSLVCSRIGTSVSAVREELSIRI